MADQNDREEEDYEVAYQLQMQETLDATRRSGSQEAAQRADQGDEKSTKLCFAGRPCGYGAVILLPDGDVMWSKGQHLDETTNTKAAYAGLLAGLQACRDFGIDQVIAEGDSELLVKQMNGESAASDPNLVHLVKEVRAIVQYMSSFKLRFIHKRNNAMADQLAHDAAPRQSGAKRRRGSDDVAEVFVVDEEVAEPCGICLENVSIKQIYVVGECSHRFCKSCLDTLIAQHATDKKFPVPCPAPQCITTISTAECAALTSSAPALEILQKLEVETCIPASQRFYCPHASCSALMTRPDDLSETGNNAAECLECHRMVCMRCAVAWHAGYDCAQYQDLPPHLKSNEDRQLAELAQNKGWRSCEQCARVIELSAGHVSPIACLLSTYASIRISTNASIRLSRASDLPTHPYAYLPTHPYAVPGADIAEASPSRLLAEIKCKRPPVRHNLY